MPFTSTSCRAFLLVLGLGAAAALDPVRPAHADPSPAELQQAKTHFAQGKTFYEQGNLQLARAEFEESYRLSRRPDLLFNLALVAEKLGVFRESADYLLEYLRQRPDAPDRKSIQRSIDELERRAEVQRQKEQPAPAPTPAPAPEPAQVPLARPVMVPVTPEAPRRAPPWAAIGLMGGGVALVAVGAGLGGAAAADARSVEQRFDPALDARGPRLQAAGIAMDVIGAAAIVAGGAWTLVWLGRRESPARVSILPVGTGVSLSGSF